MSDKKYILDGNQDEGFQLLDETLKCDNDNYLSDEYSYLDED